MRTRGGCVVDGVALAGQAAAGVCVGVWLAMQLDTFLQGETLV